jgi:integrase
MATPKVNLRKRKTKKGVSYFIDYAVNGKRYREAVGDNKKNAEQIQAKVKTDLAFGKYHLPSNSQKTISLDQIINNFLVSKRNHIQPSSLKRYKNYFDTFQEYFENYFSAACVDVRNIKSSYINECFNYLLENKITNDKSWDKKTVNGLRDILKQMFKYAIKEGFCEDNPLADVKGFTTDNDKKAEYFTDGELQKIWKKLDPYWVAPLKFIVNTGLRKGEMINLKWVNVKLSGDYPTITIESTVNWRTKTGKARVVPLNSIALDIIQKQKGKHPEYVFISKSGKKIHQDKPYSNLKRALKKIALNGDVHKLRHTFASNLVMNGDSLYTISKLLGHSDLETTQIYAHLAPGYLKAAVDKLVEEET